MEGDTPGHRRRMLFSPPPGMITTSSHFGEPAVRSPQSTHVSPRGSPGASFHGEDSEFRKAALADDDILSSAPAHGFQYHTIGGDTRPGRSQDGSAFGRPYARSRQPTEAFGFDLGIGEEFLGARRHSAVPDASFSAGADAVLDDIKKNSRFQSCIMDADDYSDGDADESAGLLGGLLGGNDDTELQSSRTAGAFLNGIGAPRPLADAKLGTFTGVFTPCVAAICNSILFLRHPWVYGQVGFVCTEVMMLFCSATTSLTALSMSAVATNGCVKSGGTYFMISRTLGPEAGGAVGIAFYLATVLSIAINFLGAVEILLKGFEVSLDLHGWEHFSLALTLTVPCVLIVFAGSHHVTRAVPLFVCIAQIGILSMWIGLLSDWGDTSKDCAGIAAENCTMDLWTDNQLPQNLWPGLTPGVDWTQVFGIYFSSATGITAGANMCASLKEPQRSIPKGTLYAIGYTYGVYVLHALLFCMAVGRGVLVDLENNASHMVAFPNPQVVKYATFAATMAAGLVALSGAPRLLQGIAWDRVIPVLNFTREDTRHEPRKALLFTWLLSVSLMMMGNLNTITPVCTLFYLMFYAFANAACCILFAMRAPNFRPSFTKANTYTSGLGFALCIGGMFVVNAYYAALCLAFSASVAVYIGLHGQQKGDEWGDAWFDLRWYFTRKSLLKLDTAGPMHYKNWRPNLMLLTKIDVSSNDGTPYFQEEELVTFLSHLRHARGLQIMGTVVELDVVHATFHHDGDMAHNPRAYTLDYHMMREAITSLCHQRKMKCFSQIVASKVDVGISTVIQTAGVGRFQPNIVVMGWPQKWRVSEHSRSAFLAALRTCDLLHKALLVLQSRVGGRYGQEYPQQPEPGQTIDIWWNPHSGGLLLLIAHLVHHHRSWRACPMRCFSLVYPGSDHELVLEGLERVFAELRLNCEVSIVEFSGEDAVGSYSGFGDRVDMNPSLRNSFIGGGLGASAGHRRASRVSGAFRHRSDDEVFLSLPRQSSAISMAVDHLPTFERLNKLMRHYSKNAALVCLNLPRPSQSLLHGSPRASLLHDYLSQIDTMTADLPATILIRDSGHDQDLPMPAEAHVPTGSGGRRADVEHALPPDDSPTFLEAALDSLAAGSAIPEMVLSQLSPTPEPGQ
eukprot:TRINITY_DN8932_c0_g1_i1.p1 TRINITY_DN8932_c0_g1~~TRINITY_DN8932_c0_g1_i1.p1  ORF type:complete len:1132 (+),score=323.34 TRINITY_DN8932_c0_g1_i1:136-3531(+)